MTSHYLQNRYKYKLLCDANDRNGSRENKRKGKREREQENKRMEKIIVKNITINSMEK